jgi:hypothetical protein
VGPSHQLRRLHATHLASPVSPSLSIAEDLTDLVASTYVGLPKIAQSDVNKSELFAVQQDILDPTPSSVFVKMQNKIINHSLFTPSLDGFTVDLFLENTLPNYKPFGRLNIPPAHVTKETNVTIEQTLEILDQDQFAAYNKLVTQSETYRVALRGKTKLHLGALPVVTVDYNKVLTTKGMWAEEGSPLYASDSLMIESR